MPPRPLVPPGSLLRPPGTPLTHGMSFLTIVSHPASLSVIIELSEARNKLVTRVNQDHLHTVIQCIFGGVGFYEP